MAHVKQLNEKENSDRMDMKSAVISGAFEGYSKDEIDRFYTQNLSEVQSATKPKKGSFQITSVIGGNHTTRDDDPGEDSQDELDDTHTYTEDNMSMDWSKHTDVEQDRSSIVEEESPVDEQTLPRTQPKIPETIPPVKERSSTDNQSRFRVVKIVTHEPFKRGRWTCFDFLPDPNKPNPENVNLDLRETKDHVVVTGSETSSAASSIHYVHGQDEPGKNPLATQTLTSPIYFDDQSKPQHPVLSGHDNLIYDHHENSNPNVKMPDSFPLNGNGQMGYGSVQPPVHQASISQTSLVSNPLQSHSTSQTGHSQHVQAGVPGEKNVSNVLSNYHMDPGASNGPFTDVSHSTPRLAHRSVTIDKQSRTHRISIGGEELELSDDFGKTGHLWEQIAGIPGALASPTKETDGEDSGPNSVAIDNKIEQAMDLVKSHLMFAVREEVEVLKEQILELNDSKRKLEHENAFLKSHASAETLAALAASQQNQPLPPST